MVVSRGHKGLARRPRPRRPHVARRAGGTHAHKSCATTATEYFKEAPLQRRYRSTPLARTHTLGFLSLTVHTSSIPREKKYQHRPSGLPAREMSFQLHLHGLSYELRVSADDGALHLDLEEHDGGQLWMGDFSAQYVEEITRKTGSFKKFALFVQMLEAALGDESESVFVDVLTYADLQALKSRKAVWTVPALRRHDEGQAIRDLCTSPIASTTRCRSHRKACQSRSCSASSLAAARERRARGTAVEVIAESGQAVASPGIEVLRRRRRRAARDGGREQLTRVCSRTRVSRLPRCARNMMRWRRSCTTSRSAWRNCARARCAVWRRSRARATARVDRLEQEAPMTATHCGQAAPHTPARPIAPSSRAPLSDTRGACAQRSLAKHERNCPSVVPGPAREEGGGAAATHRAHARGGETGSHALHHASHALQSPPPPPPPPRPRAHVYAFTAPPLQAARGRAKIAWPPPPRGIRLALRPLRPPSRGPTILAQLRAHPLARRRATRRTRRR